MNKSSTRRSLIVKNLSIILLSITGLLAACGGVTSTTPNSTTTTTIGNTTTTSLGVLLTKAESIAYESCKIWRENEFMMFDNLSAAYPYSDNAQHLMIAISGAIRAKKEMKSAAMIDPSYSIYVSSIDEWIPYLWRDYNEAKSGKHSSYNPNQPFGAKFDELCTSFGVYPSQKGKLPPIDYIPKYPTSTPLNGARRVCHEVFFISPDKVVYNGKEAFNLYECDQVAQTVADQSDSYQSAFDEMKSQVFSRYDQWCWYQDCKSRWDIM